MLAAGRGKRGPCYRRRLPGYHRILRAGICPQAYDPAVSIHSGAIARVAGVLAILGAGIVGCSSAPPTAASIARRIPGCHPYWTGPVDVQAMQEVTCNAPGAAVWVAAFSSAALERQWLSADAVGAGGCVQGNGWAALVSADNAAGDWHWRDARTVAAHTGGRLVSGIGLC